MMQDLLQLNLGYLHYVSDSKLNFTEWITPIFPRILKALKMYTKRKSKIEISQTLSESFTEKLPMTDQEKLRQHLFEVEIYKLISCAVHKMVQDHKQNKTSRTQTMTETKFKEVLNSVYIALQYS